MLTSTEEGRAWMLRSAWFSEDKTVTALKKEIGVRELPTELVSSAEEAQGLLSRLPSPQPVDITINLSSRAFMVLVAVNVLTASIALPLNWLVNN